MSHARSLAWILAAALLPACASSQRDFSGWPQLVPAPAGVATAARPITNAIFIVQADRSFNDLFAGYPGADSSFDGGTHTGTLVQLKAVPLSAPPCAIAGYGPSAFVTAYARGEMDGWDLLDRDDPLCPYTYVRSDIPYRTLAREFTVGDRTFTSSVLGEFAGMQYLIAGSAQIAPGTYAVGVTEPGGCDSPPGAATIVLRHGKIQRNGPFPCFAYPTIATLLDKGHVSWKWYAAKNSPWNPWEFIKYVRDGPDWSNVSMPETNVFADLKNGKLASVSWVTPSLANSDDPTSQNAGGPAWVKSLVDAVRHSKYWSHTAIVVLWDDGGGGQFFDPVAPPQLSDVGLGFRVPLLAVSPFARTGYVAHEEFETGGSTLRFIEDNWKLGSLRTTDSNSASVGELFRK